MRSLYVDTSALGRVLLGQPDGTAVRRALRSHEETVSSQLTRIELGRLAARHDRVAEAALLLDGVAMIPLSVDVMTRAETIEPTNVATLDAIHLATAVCLHSSLGLAALLTYDRRLAEGARHHGIEVLAPA